MSDRAYEELDSLLTKLGGTLECYSPLEIRHDETGSFATLWAAQIVIEVLKKEEGIEDE